METITIPTPIGHLTGEWQGVGDHHTFTVRGKVKPTSAVYDIHIMLYWQNGQHAPVIKGDLPGTIYDSIWRIRSDRTWQDAPFNTRVKVGDAIRSRIFDTMKATAPNDPS